MSDRQDGTPDTGTDDRDAYGEERSGGPMARLADFIGCSEGRAYTVVIGLVLALLLIYFGMPSS